MFGRVPLHLTPRITSGDVSEERHTHTYEAQRFTGLVTFEHLGAASHTQIL